MNILGLSCFFHDAAAALLKDGQLVAAAEEERFTRVKHDPSFPSRAIAFCLETAGMSAHDLDYVVFFEKPFLKLERLLLSCLATYPSSRRLFQEAMISWLGDKLWIKHLIQRSLGVAPQRIAFSEHHLSHAASAFFCSPYNEAAILAVDGVGEWATASVAVGRGNEIRLLSEIKFPHSLGLVYSAFTAFLGFEVNEGEYKVMGMAPYGRPRFMDEVYRVIRPASDGSFELDLDYFSFHRSPDRTYSSKFEALFGPPRQPGMPWKGRYADIAASVQTATEEIVLRMARHAHRLTGLTRLCLAGGVALNSVANGRLLREGPFEEIYIQPAAGDSGAALGAALYMHHMALGEPRGFVMDHAAWGAEYTSAAIHSVLQAAGVPWQHFGNEDDLIEAVVSRLQSGAVTGWMQGRFEFGPRALGHRSILADPRRPEIRDIVNQKVKFRESFRPFAPAVPVDVAAEFFGLPKPARHYPARFMLYVVPVHCSDLPAVTHVDGSARVQTLFQDTNGRFYRLVDAFGQASGIPVLLNTSFNLQREPIVNTPLEALETWRRSGMDLLVLGDFLVEKNGSRT